MHALYCIALHCMAWHGMAWHYITSHHVTSRHVMSRHITSRHVTTRYVTLRYMHARLQRSARPLPGGKHDLSSLLHCTHCDASHSCSCKALLSSTLRHAHRACMHVAYVYMCAMYACTLHVRYALKCRACFSCVYYAYN